MPPNDIHELYVELRVQAPAECPSCGVNDWLDTPEVPVVLPHVDLSGPKPVSMSRTEALFMIVERAASFGCIPLKPSGC
jgi:hypothetical protein